LRRRTQNRSDVEAAAAAAAAEVLDSPAAAAVPGEREVVAESLRRLADALSARAQRKPRAAHTSLARRC
jgi:hypothetical protein